MKTLKPTIASCLTGSHWRKLIVAGAALLLAGAFSPLAQAQTTIKPSQIRVEVPTGFNGTVLLTNNVMRVATNGASELDGTGTNWVIAPVNLSITGTPAGVTASLLARDLVTPVTTVPVNMSINNASQSTNLIVQLVFDGSETSGTSTLSVNANGAVTNDNVFLTLEVGKIWNGPDNAAVNGSGNWSDPSQWQGGVPGPGDNVVFTDVGMQTNSEYGFGTGSTNYLKNSIVDVSTVIASLRFCATNSATNYANLYINPGVNLAIAGKDGFSMLRDYPYYNASKMNVTIAGTNGFFIQTNENSSFSFLIDGQIASVLDMSGLGNMTLDVSQVNVGDIFQYPNYLNLATNGFTSGSTLGGSLPNKVLPTWLMAMTNYVRAVYADPYNYTNADDRNYSMMIGRNNITGGSSGTDFNVEMGAYSVFDMDSICVAGYASLGSVLQFANTNSYAIFRNTDGVSPMSMFATADAAGTTYNSASGANTKSGPVDFSKGYVDMLVDRFYLSRDRGHRIDSGNGDSQTAMVFAQGIINANTAILGFQNEGSQTNLSYCNATMIVSNTAVFQVNGNLALGYTTCTNGAVNDAPGSDYGQIAIGPGGTVEANNITVGGVTKQSGKNQITLKSGASLIVSNSIADTTPNGALGTLSFGGNSSLTLFVNGTNTQPLVCVTNLSASGTGNQIIIGGVQNMTYPADIPLILGANNTIPVDSSVFDAGVVVPAGLHGTLVTSATNSINLILVNRTPNYLLWRAPAGASGTANWDHTSKVWLDQVTGLMTNFNDADVVAFDDAPGYATNVVITDASTIAAAINMTNSALYYTFQDGGGSLIGGPVLDKQGTGTLEVDANTSCNVLLNQGVLVGSGGSSAIGGVTIAAGGVMDYSGAIGGSLNCAGTATSAGSISGSLTVLNGGVVTNSGSLANPFTVENGGLLYNSGSMAYIGVGTAALPQVASGGTFINSGSIGTAGGGNVLFVNGTFEDLGGGSDNMTLYAVSIGAGATFLPGADGLGITTINSDGTSTYPGAALLAQGSTNVFNIDVDTSGNTVLTAAHLSFGGSASSRTENGCTIQINNVGSAPFSAGQSFPLFNNVYIPGTPPFSTGTSTNTYPVILPKTPGTGLAWDLSKLWVNGSIGVVSANSGPVFSNAFTFVGGTNIVGQFSWDPSYLGYRLQTLVTPNTVGLAIGTNYSWTGVNGSWTNDSITITNKTGTNDVGSGIYYRLVFP